MKFWLDQHLSPQLAQWIEKLFNVKAYHISQFGLEFSEDLEIYEEARKNKVIFITKDKDFIEILDRKGPPPRVLWLRTGNTSNKELKRIFKKLFPKIFYLFRNGEILIEISKDTEL